MPAHIGAGTGRCCKLESMKPSLSLGWSAGVLALLVAAVASTAIAAAQQPTFRSGTQVVSVFATVLDAQNRLVPDLTEQDFEVLDNEKPQPLIVFKNDPQPITVVVMLDTSGSMTGTIGLLKSAAEQFLIRLLPDDKAAVGAFNDKIELGAHFSNNRDALVADVKDIDYGNGTRLNDELEERRNAPRGIERRSVSVMFTDGDDTASRIGRGPVLERARAEEVMIYAIGLESNFFDGVRQVRTKPDSGLKKLAEETGGGYFE